ERGVRLVPSPRGAASQARAEGAPARASARRSRGVGARGKHLPFPRASGSRGEGAVSTVSHASAPLRHRPASASRRGPAVTGRGGGGSFRRAAVRAAGAFAAVALAACSKGAPQGRRLASGLARDLIVAPGGRMIAFLQGASHPEDRGVPDDLLVGDLMLASTSEDSPAQRVGGGVATLPGARAFSPGGEWLAFLARWRFRAGEGELWLAESPGMPRKVADGVSAMSWAPSGSLLAFVAHGRLMVLDASKEPA